MADDAKSQGETSAPCTLDKTASSAESFPSSRQMKWLVTLLLLYFGLRLCYFAINISPSAPPDEETHYGISQIFSRVLLLPVNSPETYRFGLVTNVAWLYYWLMGKLLHLNIFGLPDLVFLRILNIPFAFGTVCFAWRTLRLITEDRLARILLLVAMTNTLMFTFLSASVSYDNLTNLLAAMSVYYLLAFFKNRSGSLLLLSFVCQLAGCLTKQTFLPLVMVLNIILVIHEGGNLRDIPSAFVSLFRHTGKRNIGLLLSAILLLALNVNLYAGNYIHFGKLTPEMPEVLSPEIAMQNRIHARNIIFTQFREGRISKEKALAMTSAIRHQPDRASAVALIEGYDYRKNISGYHVMALPAYISFWIKAMLHGTYGIFAHLPVPQSSSRINLVRALFLMAALSFLIRWRPRDTGWLPLHLVIIAAFYGIFLMYVINYGSYVDSRATWLGLQGRYIFPVLSPIYVFLSYYLMQLFSGRRARLALFSAAALIFIACDLPFFLSFATPEWFAMLGCFQQILSAIPSEGNLLAELQGLV